MQNWKIGHSRLSLNDAFVVDGPPNMPPALFPQPAYVPIPPPTLKQFKKWQKKQKKLLRKMGSVPPAIIPPHTPMAPLLPYTRAFSVDNLSRFYFSQQIILLHIALKRITFSILCFLREAAALAYCPNDSSFITGNYPLGMFTMVPFSEGFNLDCNTNS